VDNFWEGKRVLVTGGAGFIGSHVVQRLVETRGVSQDNIRVPRSAECDLRTFENARQAVQDVDIVLHLAADVGGLGYSSTHAAQQYYNCALIDLQVVEAARQEGVSRFIGVSSSTAYPAVARSPLREEILFAGKPRDTHLGYGAAKRNIVVIAQVYHRQYDMDMAVVVANNVYGPGDNFDPQSSHVIPALIRKALEDPQLTIWGDGTPVRDFLYVEDLAEAILLAAEKLPAPTYVNIGSGQATSIRELVHAITELTKFEGEIHFDATKPKGEPRRTVSIEKAQELLGFEPRFSLEDGLRRTIDWYRETCSPELVRDTR
jgi:GDP-L-fucose synthase